MWCTAQSAGRLLLPPSECYWLLTSTTPVLRTIASGWVLRSYFSPFVDQSSPHYVSRRGRDRRLQRRFLIVDIWFQSGDIRDRSTKSAEIVPKKHVFRPQIFFGGRTPKFWTYFLKLHPFPIMWQNALNKKRKKETAAKHKGRVTGGPKKGRRAGTERYSGIPRGVRGVRTAPGDTLRGGWHPN